MEKIVEFNHNLLSKIPLGIQNILKSLPLSDYSIILILCAIGVVGIPAVLLSCKQYDYIPLEDFDDIPSPAKVPQVKVKIPNTKKARRGKKRPSVQEDSPEVQEEQRTTLIEGHDDQDWKTILPKNPRKKNQ